MAKRCELTGVGVQSGNNVSHSHRKTRRRFLPNLQAVSLTSDILGQSFKFKITAATLRTVDHNGGFDGFLLNSFAKDLTLAAQKLRRRVKKKAVEQKLPIFEKKPVKKKPSARSALKKKPVAKAESPAKKEAPAKKTEAKKTEVKKAAPKKAAPKN